MSQDEADQRQLDIKALLRHDVGGWNYCWENGLSRCGIGIKDENQKAWHESRMSFLAGFLTARGVDPDEIKEIIKATRHKS